MCDLTTALSIERCCWVTSGGQFLLQLPTPDLDTISPLIPLLFKVPSGEREQTHHVAMGGVAGSQV